MSLATEADSITTKIRHAIAFGLPLTGQDLRQMQSFIYAVQSANDAYKALVTTLGTDVAAQMAILQAKGTGDASAEIDDCDTLLTADVAAAAAAVPVTITAAHDASLDGDEA